jgi:hypothetical protein
MAAEAAVQAGLGPVVYALACASHTYSLAVLALFSPVPLAWHLPLHLASTAAQLWHNRAFCSTPLMESLVAARLFGRLQAALAPLQLLVPAPLTLPALAQPRGACSATVSWFQVRPWPPYGTASD